LTRTLTSRDGTIIGYRQLGNGPGVVLLHGAGQSSQNFLTLARAMADQFTLYVPDRRGRAMSGPYCEDHGLDDEVEDLEALLSETGAHYVFGLSSGAVIALQAALRIPSITMLALYEPPLETETMTQRAWVPRYERELARGDLAAALVTVLKGTADRTALRFVPRALLEVGIRLGIRAAARKPSPPGVVHPLDLIATIHYDAIIVAEAAGPLERFASLGCEVLLLGGKRSNKSLEAAVDGLAAVLPGARRVTLSGVGHTAADNGGKPELVAAELRSFFDG
jgi:pimeloyl-ACP methyl ester carboxylesterase